MNTSFKVNQSFVARYQWIACCLLLGTGVATASEFTRVRQQDYPHSDAVVLRWDQTYTLQTDGTLVYEEHRFVQLLDNRAWRRHADPRVRFVKNRDEVTLIAARAHTPDGTILELPPYSTHETSPALAKWPAFADEREMVYTMSGVQNNSVLEFHFRRTSVPGFRRLEDEISIGGIDPIVERTVTITAPGDTGTVRTNWTRPEPRVSGRFGGDQREMTVEFNEREGKTWRFTNIPGFTEEPHAIPWQQRRGRIHFSDRSSRAYWPRDIIERIENAATADDSLSQFAREAVEESVSRSERINAVFGHIRKHVAWVRDDRAWQFHDVRPAPVVLAARYGSTLEIAALAVAVLRATGETPSPYVAIDALTSNPDVLTNADLSSIIIGIGQGDAHDWVHPFDGLVNRQGTFATLTLLDRNAQQVFPSTTDTDLFNRPADEFNVTGRLAFNDDLTALSGKLEIDIRRGFIDTTKTVDAGQRRGMLTGILRQLIEGVEVTDDQVSLLTDDRLRMTLDVKVKEPMTDLPGARALMLAESSPAIHRAGIPFGMPSRRTPAALRAPVREEIDIRIAWPESMQAASLPASMAVGLRGGIKLQQDVQKEKHAVRIRRSIAIGDLTPATYFEVRNAVKDLGSMPYRALLLQEQG